MNREGPWDGLPGADLIEQGLADLAAEQLTEHALLVLVGEPRLRRLDIAFHIPTGFAAVCRAHVV